MPANHDRITKITVTVSPEPLKKVEYEQYFTGKHPSREDVKDKLWGDSDKFNDAIFNSLEECIDRGDYKEETQQAIRLS